MPDSTTRAANFARPMTIQLRLTSAGERTAGHPADHFSATVSTSSYGTIARFIGPSPGEVMDKAIGFVSTFEGDLGEARLACEAELRAQTVAHVEQQAAETDVLAEWERDLLSSTTPTSRAQHGAWAPANQSLANPSYWALYNIMARPTTTSRVTTNPYTN